VRHDSPEGDRSPPRRATRHDSPEPNSGAAAAASSAAAAGSSSAAAAAPAAASASKQGLVLASEFQQRNAAEQARARADLERIAGGGAAAGGGETVIRDKSGKKITLEQYEKQLADERAKKESKPMEWASGLAQQAAAAAEAVRLAQERLRPFARTVDDADLNAAQKAVDRWGDPMLAQIRRNEEKAAREALATAQAAQEKLAHKQRKAMRKEIKKEKKELRKDKRKLIKQLDAQRILEAASGSSGGAPLIDKAEQDRLVDELLGAKEAALARKKRDLKTAKTDLESRIALDLAAGGSGIVVPEAKQIAAAARGEDVVREPRPMYRGTPWPNRFGILPGYRWDGVVRGIEWESRITKVANNRQFNRERAWKAGSEDM
jgi:hypothetical protein